MINASDNDSGDTEPDTSVITVWHTKFETATNWLYIHLDLSTKSLEICTQKYSFTKKKKNHSSLAYFLCYCHIDSSEETNESCLTSLFPWESESTMATASGGMSRTLQRGNFLFFLASSLVVYVETMQDISVGHKSRSLLTPRRRDAIATRERLVEAPQSFPTDSRLGRFFTSLRCCRSSL